MLQIAALCHQERSGGYATVAMMKNSAGRGKGNDRLLCLSSSRNDSPGCLFSGGISHNTMYCLCHLHVKDESIISF